MTIVMTSGRGGGSTAIRDLTGDSEQQADSSDASPDSEVSSLGIQACAYSFSSHLQGARSARDGPRLGLHGKVRTRLMPAVECIDRSCVARAAA